MSESKRPRGKYKTTNWASYNASLKARGSLTVWLDKDLQWYAPATGKRGRQPIFSDATIQFCLSIKSLFGLPLRQILGMVESLLRLAGLEWKVPDFSTVCGLTQRSFASMPTAGTTNLEEVDWLPPAQPGGDEDELLQAAWRAGDGQDV